MDNVYLSSNEDLQVYPYPEIVLERKVDRDYLLPIGLLKKYGQDLLIAIPIADEEGVISWHKPQTHFCGEFHISYSFNGQKWAIDCDPALLSISKMDGHYWKEKVEKSFEETKKFFKENSFIQYHTNKPVGYGSKLPLFYSDDMFLSSFTDNFFSYVPEVIKTSTSENEEYKGKKSRVINVFTERNIEYQYIGRVESFHFSRPITSLLHFFYDKKNQRILVVAEYT